MKSPRAEEIITGILHCLLTVAGGQQLHSDPILHAAGSRAIAFFFFEVGSSDKLSWGISSTFSCCVPHGSGLLVFQTHSVNHVQFLLRPVCVHSTLASTGATAAGQHDLKFTVHTQYSMNI